MPVGSCGEGRGIFSIVWELYMSCWGLGYDGLMWPKKSESGRGRSSVDDTTWGLASVRAK